jgi:hypothetical protein
LFTQERVATNAGLFLEGLLEMSSARPVGCARRRLAIPAHGGSRRFWVVETGDADALCDIVHDYVIEHLADDDAVLVIDETGFASWPCVHRSRVVSSEGMDRRSRSSGSHICACRCRLCDQTKACDENDRMRDSCVCTIQVGCR